jgi:isopenicillin-N epimerase
MRLGTALRDEYGLDPAFLTVNHGSYGATPRAVLAAQDIWRARMEAQPTRFMTLELPGALRAAASRLAAFLGVDSDELAFVENATVGCNAVLRSMDLAAGDEILVLDHGYGAVVKTARYVAARVGARVVEAAIPFPAMDEAALVAEIAARIGPRTRLAVLDHITSPSALVLPVAAMAAACRAAGVPVLVDSAHAPGNVEFDVLELGADWVTGNCHKWLSAPKGCAFLWARRERQAGLHPVTISHGYGAGFLAEFDWTGTRDPSAYLSVGAALDHHERLGGAVLRERNTALASEATALLAARLGTESPTLGRAGGCAMGLVRVPLPGTVDSARALSVRAALLKRDTDAAVQALGGSAWLRVSAAAYNELNDFARLAELLCEFLATSHVINRQHAL